jgi:hypothetical protein
VRQALLLQAELPPPLRLRAQTRASFLQPHLRGHDCSGAALLTMRR